MRIIKDVIYKSEDSCKLDIYLPSKDGFETFVWFHGGGLENGDKESGKKLAEAIIEAGYAFVSVEYRMYTGGARFPDFLLDAADAVAFVKENIENYGGKKDRLYISGQSAGAWISLMLCMNREFLERVGIDNKEILGWVIDSAQTTAHFNVLKYELGEDSRAQRINEFAPQFYVSDRTDFSKILLIMYEKDMPCRYEQNMLFYKSILGFNETADIMYKVLPGEHCHGSCVRDGDGQYAYVKTMLQWLKNREREREL